MKTVPPVLRQNRRLTTFALLALVTFGIWLCAPLVQSQSPAASTANPAISALLLKLKTQQDTMVANQTKIEAQTTLLKENLRQAKIYSARSGSGRR